MEMITLPKSDFDFILINLEYNTDRHIDLIKSARMVDNKRCEMFHLNKISEIGQFIENIEELFPDNKVINSIREKLKIYIKLNQKEAIV